ncbi:TetR/AcrR family transcriptional regulator [Prosthecochloris sp. ZM_2]|uniref:TetR/AcrR family transcriptional regulator n=1 Tax=Prosthecochloris sp. ZM_2 TaxID=2045206 RepID=UPI000DF7A522|nr:TetR/AcrR family transcriptional regulator [Prosthecochloris sp. ZM_2]RNA65145.1 TetR/AcrR family transcriptional regulator [Prosthecochloris sp. ZM_2]
MKTYATSEHTREALLHAAGELAAEKGFANVSTREIARRAEENIGSIHYHYGGKEQLFEAVVQRVIERGNTYSIEAAVSPFRSRLDTPEGQSGALRAIVRREIQVLFDSDQPGWHCRIVYQLMQYKSPLQDKLQKELLDPMVSTISEVLQHISPWLTRQETMLISFLMISPIVSHADYMPFCLEQLNLDRYSDDYLQTMENFIVRQTELLLGMTTNSENKTT